MSLSRYNWSLAPAIRDEFKQAFDVFNKRRAGGA